VVNQQHCGPELHLQLSSRKLGIKILTSHHWTYVHLKKKVPRMQWKYYNYLFFLLILAFAYQVYMIILAFSRRNCSNKVDIGYSYVSPNSLIIVFTST
jgi:hypothetical protein